MLDDCCGRILGGTARAATAEALMRSRYTAFALGDEGYLARSWHPDTRPAVIHVDPDREWTGLEIVATSGGGLMDTSGTVEFRAHHRDGDGHHVLHEVSTFVRHDGRWVYLSGDVSGRGRAGRR